ncbi:DUF6082 family protein [Streptomyces sp. Tue6028]|uniref:DUF6082 family protein n=1 Tax=Streptomyces sp. Tue6028 TaxID=2036037 RepID=UPI003D7440B8
MITTLLIVITPFLLQAAAPSNRDWQRLSNISQTYGALSVLFSAAALLGIAASLVYQSQQTEIANQQAQRASHQHMIEMALNDPELLIGSEPPAIEVTEQVFRAMMFSNLLISNWLASYRLRRMNDDELRVMLVGHFKGEVPRKHWEGSSRQWQQMATASKERARIRFVSIVDETYRQAVAQGPGTPPSSYFAVTM